MSRNLQVRDLDKDSSKKLDEFKETHFINTDAKAVVSIIHTVSAQNEIIEELEKDNRVLRHKIEKANDILENLVNGFKALGEYKI